MIDKSAPSAAGEGLPDNENRAGCDGFRDFCLGLARFAAAGFSWTALRIARRALARADRWERRARNLDRFANGGFYP